jgi:hypothetical protein
VLLAPGHNPGGWHRSGDTRDDVDRATALVKEGKSAERITFTDMKRDRSIQEIAMCQQN